MLGLTQQQMAELIGVTYQQAHKYETGINRISAGRLYQIARALGVDISYFFEDVEPGDGAAAARSRELMPQQRMLLELARNFAAIKNRKHQEAVCHLARALSDSEARH
jgi:transcriptional regulator with XRE-family HTH domain